jgi:hypothetical protein
MLYNISSISIVCIVGTAMDVDNTTESIVKDGVARS